MQTVPQLPQLLESTVVSTQTPLHSVMPAAHPHTPPEHAWPAAQVFAHAPQLAGSLARLTQLFPQGVVPGAQDSPQTPAEQNCPTGHAVPQAPQLLPSLAVSTHMPEHSVLPPWQTHCAAWQSPPVGHTVPQVPQLLESVAGLMQAAPQSNCPSGQTHWPLAQV